MNQYESENKIDYGEGHLIACVEEGSIAEELELKAGDRLISINGEKIRDVFDYRYLCAAEELTLLVMTSEGEEWELDIEKDEDEDLGIVFERGLMDEYRSCRNKCIFCFIDQMPKGMRDTLYFKDDDARLSFLQGNYITLTNLSDEDVERICFYRLSPINVSIHTLDADLRCRMLQNKKAGAALKRLDRFMEAGLDINGQIVLCKGWNDGEELEKTLEGLAGLLPNLKSLSIVPVGLTDHRDGLTDLVPFDRDDAKELIRTVRKWQRYYLDNYGTRLVYASDEWYLRAGEAIPADVEYEGYPQIENGVGMLRSFVDEFHDGLGAVPDGTYENDVTIATGLLMADTIQRLSIEAASRFPGVRAKCIAIRNDFFGEKITVSGLLTGGDIIRQLKGRRLGKVLLLPENLLRSGEDVLLDDVTVGEIADALQIEVRVVKSNGISFLNALLNVNDD